MALPTTNDEIGYRSLGRPGCACNGDRDDRATTAIAAKSFNVIELLNRGSAMREGIPGRELSIRQRMLKNTRSCVTTLVKTRVLSQYLRGLTAKIGA